MESWDSRSRTSEQRQPGWQISPIGSTKQANPDVADDPAPVHPQVAALTTALMQPAFLVGKLALAPFYEPGAMAEGAGKWLRNWSGNQQP